MAVNGNETCRTYLFTAEQICPSSQVCFSYFLKQTNKRLHHGVLKNSTKKENPRKQ